MFKAIAAASCVLVCCMGNPSASKAEDLNIVYDPNTGLLGIPQVDGAPVTTPPQSVNTNTHNHYGERHDHLHTGSRDLITHEGDNSGNVYRGAFGGNYTSTNNSSTTTDNRTFSTSTTTTDNRTTNNSSTTTTNNASFFEPVEPLQHANVPNPVGPTRPDAIAVFTIYGQVDQVGPVAGFSLSIPLAN